MPKPSGSTPAVEPEEIAPTLQQCGVAGAGGAGFPSYVKWSSIADVDSLLVNHQESEPNCYTDKWLGRTRADELARFFDALLVDTFETIVVGTKVSYRDRWLAELEAATDATVYGPADLPLDPAEESGVVVAYTPDVYTYSEESVLLMVTAGVQIGEDLPTDHGWIVHNTETLFNVSRAVLDDQPVTRKFVHVDGEVDAHRCLDVPVGTPVTALLELAGGPPDGLGEEFVVADGGPGWCYEVTEPLDAVGVRKRTNAFLVLDAEVAREHTGDRDQIDVRNAADWTAGPHETEPTTDEPSEVLVPLITNAAYEGLVSPSVPTVSPGDEVAVGDVVAAPGDGISIAQHASIDGCVAAVEDDYVHVVAE